MVKAQYRGFNMLLVGIFILAGLGALLRFGLHNYSGGDGWSVGVLVANVIGSAAIGYVLTQPQWLTSLSPHATKMVAIGFLGALTTFSSYSVDVVSAFTSGNMLKAASLFVGHNVLAISACLLTYRFAA